MSKTAKAAAELAAVLAYELADRASLDGGPSPEAVAADALALLRIGSGIARRAVQRCNGVTRWRNGVLAAEWTDEDEAKADRADKKAENAAAAIAGTYGAKVRVGGDPRGFTLRLILESGRSNSFAGDGWGVA